MQDLNADISGLDQRASGTITVTAFASLAGKTVTVNSVVLTEGVEFTAATSNNATATSLAAAIHAISGVNAAAVSAVITVRADAPGTAGNAIGMATNATEGITLSGATLSGGVAETVTATMSLVSEQGEGDVEWSINVTAFTGASGSLIITPQYSYDKSTWFDDSESVFTTINSGTTLPFKETKEMNFTGQFVRLKLVTSGVVSSVTLEAFGRSVVGG